MFVKRATRHLTLLILTLVAGVSLPFVFFGDQFEAVFSLEGARSWMENYGRWAWLAGIGLLVADLVLPVPGTVVMSALGWKYGWFWGGCLSAGGSCLAGITGYGLCRFFGRPAARWIAGEDGLEQARQLFEHRGGWLVALSRWMPVLPEAVSCLAGLAQMPWRTYWIALLCGSLPLGFAFAAIGHLGQSNPGLAIFLSALLPVSLWLLARRWLSRKCRDQTSSPSPK